MTTKRGEGAAKRRELSQRLRRIATGLRLEGAINMAGTFVQAAEVIEASAPSTLIAAVEAIQNERAADYNGNAPILQRPRPRSFLEMPPLRRLDRESSTVNYHHHTNEFSPLTR